MFGRISGNVNGWPIFQGVGFSFACLRVIPFSMTQARNGFAPLTASIGVRSCARDLLNISPLARAWRCDLRNSALIREENPLRIYPVDICCLLCRHTQSCRAGEREHTACRSRQRSTKRRGSAARPHRTTQWRIVGKMRSRLACGSRSQPCST